MTARTRRRVRELEAEVAELRRQLADAHEAADEAQETAETLLRQYTDLSTRHVRVLSDLRHSGR